MNHDAHGVEHLVIMCSDYRINLGKLQKFNDRHGQADLIVWPGASNVVRSESTRSAAIAAIRKLHELHGFKHLHIIDHFDCGAYNGSKIHENKEAETEAHRVWLYEAKRLLEPVIAELGLNIHLHMVDLDLNWIEIA